MKKYQDSLRGGYEVYKRDNFQCCYCGFDGRPFPSWFQLSIDHILPRGQGGSNELENLATVCQACNSITSRMKFDHAMSVEQILKAKISRVRKRQEEYFQFWRKNVAPFYLDKWKSGELTVSDEGNDDLLYTSS